MPGKSWPKNAVAICVWVRSRSVRMSEAPLPGRGSSAIVSGLHVPGKPGKIATLSSPLPRAPHSRAHRPFARGSLSRTWDARQFRRETNGLQEVMEDEFYRIKRLPPYVIAE